MNPLQRLRLAAQAVREAIPEQRPWTAPEVRNGERLLESGRYAEAEQCLLRVLTELEANDAVRPHHGHLLVCLASAFLAQKKLSEAKLTAGRTIELLTDARLRASTDLASAQEMLGRVELENGNMDEGGPRLLRDALRTQEEVRPLDIWADGRPHHRAGLAAGRSGCVGRSLHVAAGHPGA